MPDPSRKTLLLVYHSMTGATRQMIEAVARDGAQTQTSVVPPGSNGLIPWARFRANDGGLFFFDSIGTHALAGDQPPRARGSSGAR